MEEEELKSATTTAPAEESHDDAAGATTTADSEVKPIQDKPADVGDSSVAPAVSPKSGISVASGETPEADKAVVSPAATAKTEQDIAEEEYATPDLHINKKGHAGRGIGTTLTSGAAATTQAGLKVGAGAIGVGAVGGGAVAGTAIGISAGIGAITGAGADAAAKSTAGSIFNPIGSAAKEAVWGQDNTSSYDYEKAASNVGAAGIASASAAGAVGLMTAGMGAYGWYEGSQRRKAASEMVDGPNGKQVKDAAGVSLANESITDGKMGVVKGSVSTVGAGLKIAAGAGASSAGALMTGASVLGGVGGAISVAEGGLNLYRDRAYWKNGSFEARTDKGKKWYDFVKSKKRSRAALSALKIIGGGLAIAAAAVGTAAGAGIPLLIAAGVIGAGMGISKLMKKYNNSQRIKKAKGQMKEEGWYNKDTSLPENKYNTKGTLAERNKINETKLAAKRSEKGKENAESKFSVAQGIIQTFKEVGLSGIGQSIQKVMSLIKKEKGDKKAAEINKKAQKDSQPGFFARLMNRFKSKDPSQEAPAEAKAPEVPQWHTNPLHQAEEDKIEKPSKLDEEVYDAKNISERIGVSEQEVLSGSGEELIEKKLSVTNSL